MTTNPDSPGGREPVDWDRYETELGGARRASKPTETAPVAPDATDAAAVGEGRVLVDSPQGQRPPRPGLAGLRAAQRRPILPTWLRSSGEFREVGRWAAGFVAHTSGYHLARAPVYAGRLAARAPRGTARVTGGWLRWLLDLEGEPVRQATVRAQDAEAYLKLARQRDRRVRWRALVTTALLATLALAGAALLLAPPPTRWAALALLLAGLGIVGRPADRPLLDTAVVIPRAPRLTSDMVTSALAVLGIPGINQALAKDPKAISFPSPIARDGAHGYRADVDLPLGVTAGDVIERRDRLASGLRRSLGCVWPEAVAHVHPGRLLLYVGDTDMATAKQPPWPLAKHGHVDLFRCFAFGTDQRGRQVPLTVMFASMVIGSIPRMGKTFAARLIALAAALDPLAELHLYDLKGTGDFRPLEPVAYRYRAGDDDHKADIDYGLAGARALAEELRRRAEVIRGLPTTLCPENKVTPQLARLRHLRLHPIVLLVDECQRWFEHPTHGTELKAICTDLVKRGPALGIIAIFATQRPDDGSLPAAIRDNAVLRLCLKVTDARANNMVLGSGAYGAGVQATMFTRSDKGIGYLAGEGDDPVICRTYYADAQLAERIVARARAAREQAGTLTGHAAGETPEPAGRDTLLDDTLAVLPADHDRLWTETALERLQALRPDVYRTWTREQLTAALKAHGIDTNRQINAKTPDGEPANRRGFWRHDVVDAIARRDRKPGGEAT
jgi:S-DNA-T family DNA segregation ATPase FtsK/SpoIIIE